MNIASVHSASQAARMADLNRLRDEIAQSAEEEIDRISKMESDLRELLDTLAACLRLWCEEDIAEHRETIDAVRLLERAGRAEVVKDPGGGGWLDFRLID